MFPKRFIKAIITLLLAVLVVFPFTHASAASVPNMILKSSDKCTHDICILGEHLYYNGPAGIVRCSLDGSDLSTISDKTGNLRHFIAEHKVRSSESQKTTLRSRF